MGPEAVSSLAVLLGHNDVEMMPKLSERSKIFHQNPLYGKLSMES
jgi:hypothetical protein